LGGFLFLSLFDTPRNMLVQHFQRQRAAIQDPGMKLADIKSLPQRFLCFCAQAQHLIAAQLVGEGLRRLTHRVARSFGLDLNV